MSQGVAFGIAAVTLTSRSIPPAISPSRTQPSACVSACNFDPLESVRFRLKHIRHGEGSFGTRRV